MFKEFTVKRSFQVESEEEIKFYDSIILMITILMYFWPTFLLMLF